jgi:pyruvate dehydrogenase E2 component (dihydrolipoamide acetyltransferase)
MRRTIAKRLSESMSTAPHFYLTAAVGMDALAELRRQVNEALAPEKISLNAFLVKLAAGALAQHPRLNATWAGDTIILHGSVDIGVAVALDDGLVSPVVRNCAGRRLVDIDRELTDLVERARAGKLSPEQYTGAGFTISNLGPFGIEEFTAIINPPGSAILAVGEAALEPVVENGVVVVRRRMRITLSCDHRVVDGAVGAAFLRDLKQAIESPARALL